MRYGRLLSVLAVAAALAVHLPAPASAAGGDSAVPGLGEEWTGDFDGMKERRMIRVLTVYNKMMFFTEGGRQRGTTHDLFMEFEKFINDKLKTGTLKVKVLFIPVSRDRLLPSLIKGKGDIASASLAITPGRL